MENLSLLEKLSKARIEFQNAGIKKTGLNDYTGFAYFELSDIMPKITELSEKYRFIGVISFNSEAKLKIIDIDKPDQYIEFTSPMATASVKGAQDIQNLGAVQTYMRRYLYMLAFEIIENDSFDKTQGKNNQQVKPQQIQTKPSTQPQPQTQAQQPKSEDVQKAALLEQLGQIMKTKNAGGELYFTEKEKSDEWLIFKNAPSINVINMQLERLRKTLAEREAEYMKTIPFEDDLPWKQDKK